MAEKVKAWQLHKIKNFTNNGVLSESFKAMAEN